MIKYIPHLNNTCIIYQRAWFRSFEITELKSLGQHTIWKGYHWRWQTFILPLMSVCQRARNSADGALSTMKIMSLTSVPDVEDSYTNSSNLVCGSIQRYFVQVKLLARSPMWTNKQMDRLKTIYPQSLILINKNEHIFKVYTIYLVFQHFTNLSSKVLTNSRVKMYCQSIWALRLQNTRNTATLLFLFT